MRFAKPSLSVLLVGLFAVLAATVANADTFYVDDDAPNDPGPGDPGVSDPDEDGSADHPFDAIQEGIDAATGSDEVVVLEGTYTGTGNRDLDFGGKAITVRSSDPEDPDVVAATIVDCQQAGRGFHFYSGESSSSVLDGLMITNGTASYGGAIECSASSPKISNCTISGNSAGNGGGGIHCDGSPAITNCRIVGNSAFWAAGIYCDSGSPVITNCTISGNQSDQDGGGIYCNGDSSPTITGCLITGNSGRYGGGVFCSFSDPPITNCTFSGNLASLGGGLFCNCSEVTVTNCILWGDSAGAGPEIALVFLSLAVISYSDVQGGVFLIYLEQSNVYWGEGNLEADPSFVDPDGLDNDPNTWQDNDYHLAPDSPCINKGDPSGDYTGQTDIDGEPRVMLGFVDMGSDEAAEWLGVHNITQDTWYTTIQAAIDDAVAGNDIELLPGTFTGDGNRDLDFAGKAITVRSTDPEDPDVVAVTIIDCQGTESEPHRAFKFHSGEGTDSLVAGLTITNGYGPEEVIWDGMYSVGGAVFCAGASPTIQNCVFTNNGYLAVTSASKPLSLRGGGQEELGVTQAAVAEWQISSGDPRGGSALPSREILNAAAADTNGSGPETAPDDAGHAAGGAVFCTAASPTILHCTFSDNAATSGGAISAEDNSEPTVTGCTFSGNRSELGGGILCVDSSPTVTHSTFTGNTASADGGGIRTFHGSPTVSNCTFGENSCGLTGGAICNVHGAATVTNCELSGNVAGLGGGGMWSNSASSVVSNCTFSSNSSGGYGGGGMHGLSGSSILTNCTFNGNTTTAEGGALSCASGNRVAVANCIFWANGASTGSQIALEYCEDPFELTVTYSDVQGGQAAVYVEPGCTLNWGPGNIDEDPMLADPEGRLSSGSPCIDNGNNDALLPDVADLDGDGNTNERTPLDLDENYRIINCAVDMGAYEFVTYEYDPGLPPMLCSAISRKTHCPAEQPECADVFDLYLPLVGSTECRRGDPPPPEQPVEFLTTVILVFGEPIKAIDGVLNCRTQGMPDSGEEIVLSIGSCGPASIDGLEMTIGMTGVPDQSCQTITVTGIADLTGNALTGPNQAHIGVLVGDVDGDGNVTLTDFLRAKDNNAQPVGQGDNARCDVDRDNNITLTDFLKAKDLNANAVTCP